MQLLNIRDVNVQETPFVLRRDPFCPLKLYSEPLNITFHLDIFPLC